MKYVIAVSLFFLGTTSFASAYIRSSDSPHQSGYNFFKIEKPSHESWQVTQRFCPALMKNREGKMVPVYVPCDEYGRPATRTPSSESAKAEHTNPESAEALSQPRLHSPSHIALMLAVVCVAMMCFLSSAISRKLAGHLSFGSRIVLLSTVAFVSTGGLHALGMVDEYKLLSVPLIGGLSLALLFSLKDA